MLCIQFIWALKDLGGTFGVSYLAHVGAGAATAAALACLAAAAAIGYSLFVRLAPRNLLVFGAACIAGYVLAGVFSGVASLQLLMPPMIGRPLIWAYLVTAVLAMLTLTLSIGHVRSGNRPD